MARLWKEPTLEMHENDNDRDVLAKNGRIAAAIRRDVAERRVAMFNLVGSPGAGKTTVLEAVIQRLGAEMPLAVLEGDQATSRDATRIERAGCRVLQMNTGARCHLDASMIARGLGALEPPRSSVVFVENVGGLACSALFDLGESARIVVMSVTEGEDKPLKYPHVFRAADLMILSKSDLLPHLELDEARCVAYARAVNPQLGILRLSALRGEGVDGLCAWIRAESRRSWASALEADACEPDDVLARDPKYPMSIEARIDVALRNVRIEAPWAAFLERVAVEDGIARLRVVDGHAAQRPPSTALVARAVEREAPELLGVEIEEVP